MTTLLRFIDFHHRVCPIDFRDQTDGHHRHCC